MGIARLATMLFLESVNLTKNAIALPFVSSAKTPLTGQVTTGRQFTTAGVSMKTHRPRSRTHPLNASTISH
jgi:diacylglycerol O-acyltransferase